MRSYMSSFVVQNLCCWVRGADAADIGHPVFSAHLSKVEKMLHLLLPSPSQSQQTKSLVCYAVSAQIHKQWIFISATFIECWWCRSCQGKVLARVRTRNWVFVAISGSSPAALSGGSRAAHTVPSWKAKLYSLLWAGQGYNFILVNLHRCFYPWISPEVSC